MAGYVIASTQRCESLGAGLRCQPRGTALSGGMGSWRWSLSEQPKWSEPMNLGKDWAD